MDHGCPEPAVAAELNAPDSDPDVLSATEAYEPSFNRMLEGDDHGEPRGISSAELPLLGPVELPENE